MIPAEEREGQVSVTVDPALLARACSGTNA
jgi:hypothetical protein